MIDLQLWPSLGLVDQIPYDVGVVLHTKEGLTKRLPAPAHVYVTGTQPDLRRQRVEESLPVPDHRRGLSRVLIPEVHATLPENVQGHLEGGRPHVETVHLSQEGLDVAGKNFNVNIGRADFVGRRSWWSFPHQSVGYV